MSEAPTFTVLLPVHRGPQLLPFAVRSILEQSRGDFELFIIGDGAPAETLALARDFAAADSRVRVRPHPKAGLRGEIWRAEALAEARGRYVCQLGDDDLWLPDHLEEMAALLAEVDFGNMLHVTTHPDGHLTPVVGSLEDPRLRRRMLRERFNLAGPPCVGYRLAAYRALEVGWSEAPPDLWSDLYMWRKFLRHPGLTLGSRLAVTAICLPNARRLDHDIEQRRAENQRYFEWSRDPLWRARYVARACALAAEAAQRQQRVALRELSRELEAARAETAAARDATAAAERQLAAARRRGQEAQRAAASATRRAAVAEARVAFVERSRIWRLRQRLARLLGRAR